MTAALLVAAGLPLGFYYFGHRYHAGGVEATVAHEGRLLSEMVSRNPLLWHFEIAKLDDILAKGAPSEHAELRRALDRNGGTVAEIATTGTPPDWPVIERGVELFDSGRVVGRVEIRRSLRPLLVETGSVGILAALVAGGVFAALRILPLCALGRALDRVAYLASHDPLTGLPNRSQFRDRLEQALGGERRDDGQVAVLYLDLDRFKEVNDTLGHAAGDRLLQQVAERLAGCLRRGDTLARLGGDEFAILQGGAQPDSAGNLAQRIVATLESPFDLDGHEIAVGTSVGIALAVDGGGSEVLMQKADLALYRAKADGRGTYRFFEEAMNLLLRERKALEQELRRALAEDQLELHFQPQVDLRSGRLVGVEALLRWRHRERGQISPATFIPLAEETGLILPIGAWVLRTACAQAVRWPGLSMAVNLSPVQFRQPDLAAAVARTLRETGLEAGRLELEITEGVLLQDTEATLATLAELKALGIRIAMDDFAALWSKLTTRRVPSRPPTP